MATQVGLQKFDDAVSNLLELAIETMTLLMDKFEFGREMMMAFGLVQRSLNKFQCGKRVWRTRYGGTLCG